MAKTFAFSLVTPERSVLEGEVSYANLPAHDGQLGVMRDRAAMLVELGKGTLTLDMADGSHKKFALEGGFAQMQNNKLTLLCEKATEAAA